MAYGFLNIVKVRIIFGILLIPLLPFVFIKQTSVSTTVLARAVSDSIMRPCFIAWQGGGNCSGGQLRRRTNIFLALLNQGTDRFYFFKKQHVLEIILVIYGKQELK